MLTETRHLQPHSLEIAAGRRRRHPPLHGSEGGEGCKGSGHALAQEHRHGAKFNLLRAARSRVKHHYHLGRTNPSILSVRSIEPRLEISRGGGRVAFRLPQASPTRANDALSICPSPHNRPGVNELLIKGIRRDGSTFRPSDWAERLCGVAAILHSDAITPSREHFAARPRFDCSLLVRPAIISGILCVIVDLSLRSLEPCAWDFVRCFACDNELITLDRFSSCRGGVNLKKIKEGET